MSKVQLFISPEQKTAQKAIKFKIIVINVYLKEHKHYFKVEVSSQNDTPFWCTRLAISSCHDHREFAGWRTQCHISSAIADNRRPSTSVSLSVQLERPQQTTRSRLAFNEDLCDGPTATGDEPARTIVLGIGFGCLAVHISLQKDNFLLFWLI